MTGIVAQNVGRTSGLVKAASGGGGVWTLIKTVTASSDSTIDFVDGTSDVVLDSTYPIYVFKFINIHPADATAFTFQANVAGASGFNETITSTYFHPSNQESGGVQGLNYNEDQDKAQDTTFQRIGIAGNDNDSNIGGELKIFSPSSTTFVKHWMSVTVQNNGVTLQQEFGAGYFNTTSAVDEIQFKMSSGNIDAGKIKLYGLSDS
tara:strand:- start:821 stop:1438 length:618 start_codon:yes stop_codon:yes gene_type:complete